ARRLLVVQSVSGLQGHTADRILGAQAEGAGEAARETQRVLTPARTPRSPRIPSSRQSPAGGAVHLPPPRGTPPSALRLLQRCARPASRPRPVSVIGARRPFLPRIAFIAIPLVSSFRPCR